MKVFKIKTSFGYRVPIFSLFEILFFRSSGRDHKHPHRFEHFLAFWGHGSLVVNGKAVTKLHPWKFYTIDPDQQHHMRFDFPSSSSPGALLFVWYSGI